MIRHRVNRGVTLVELTVVVAIVGILATLAFWSMTSVLPHWRLNAAARDVSSLLAVTRARAINENRTYAVEFQADRYRVFRDQNANGVLDVGELVTETRPYGQGVTYYRPTPTATTTPLPATNTVMFSPRGAASNISVGGQLVGLQTSTGTRQVQVRYSGAVRAL